MGEGGDREAPRRRRRASTVNLRAEKHHAPLSRDRRRNPAARPPGVGLAFSARSETTWCLYILCSCLLCEFLSLGSF